MSVAIHPSETRLPEGSAPVRPRLRTLAVFAGGGVTLLAFTLGAFSFFSGLADPRASKPVRIAPVASQWPDLKDGVPALAPSTAAAPAEPIKLREVGLPTVEPASPVASRTTAPVATPAPAQATAPSSAPPASVPPAVQANLPIEPVATVTPTARTAAAVAPARVVVPLPPTRTETVKAKTEQPARFVSLPAPKDKGGSKEAPKQSMDAAGAEAKPPTIARTETPKSEAARKAAPVRSRAAETKPVQTASAEASPAPTREAADEPELLGVKIPGGRQIRDGWDSAVNGLFGK